MIKESISKFKLYNSITRKKEIFQPKNGNTVLMYVCGPTVYGPVHVGHARTLLAYDLIRKYFKIFKNWDVFYVQNITDVGHIVGDIDEGEDKLQKQAKIEKNHPMEIADKYIKNMWDGLDALGCDRPNIAPRATGHIVEIIDAVSDLLNKGFAYESNGDIYFDVSKAKDYGKLSGNRRDQLINGVRIEISKNKKNPLDFALWKKADQNHIMQWTSPWGKGYPGWHIECSVMSSKYLGIPFDIHGGAVELKFPHHENEIAQSEALYGDFARFWVHTGMLMIDGQKMGKSLGNFLTIEELLHKYSPEIFRFFILSNHYRSSLDFREESLLDAGKTLEKIDNFVFQLQQKKGEQYNYEMNSFLSILEKDFETAMDNDFNVAESLSCLLVFISSVNKLVVDHNYNMDNLKEITAYLMKINKVFNCFKFAKSIKQIQPNEILDSEVEKIIKQRHLAKVNKDWELADEKRTLLEKKGIKLFDQKGGETIFKRITK